MHSVFRILRRTATRSIYIKCEDCAGHSKWANIRHIKAAKDGAKAVLFTRLSRQIRLAVQEGSSSDPQLNHQLKNVIEMALKNNMPMNSIQTSIKRSEQSKTSLKKYTLELRNKQIFMFCVVFSDNLAQTKMDISTSARKAGASFVDAAHMFDDFGLIEATADSAIATNLEDQVMEDAIECGASEVEIVNAEQRTVNFICSAIEINAIHKALASRGYVITSADHIYAAKTTITLSPAERKAHEIFLKKLSDIPGVEDVYDNVESAEE